MIFFSKMMRLVPGRYLTKKKLSNEILLKMNELSENNVKVVFDVGAHHGRFSQDAFVYFPDARIYCFEPSPASFKALQNNLKDIRFILTQKALSDTEGEKDFYINQFDETNSLLPSNITHSAIDPLLLQKEVIKVKVSTIDSFCKNQELDSLDLLKIDVQGNTLSTLKGGESLLKSKRIKLIYCEVEFLQIYQSQALFHDITSYLETFQYSLYSLYNIHYDVNNRISWADALYYID